MRLQRVVPHPVDATGDAVAVTVVGIGGRHDLCLGNGLEQAHAGHRRGDPRRRQHVVGHRAGRQIGHHEGRRTESIGGAVGIGAGLRRPLDIESTFGRRADDGLRLELRAVRRLGLRTAVLVLAGDAEPQQQPRTGIVVGVVLEHHAVEMTAEARVLVERRAEPGRRVEVVVEHDRSGAEATELDVAERPGRLVERATTELPGRGGAAEARDEEVGSLRRHGGRLLAGRTGNREQAGPRGRRRPSRDLTLPRSQAGDRGGPAVVGLAVRPATDLRHDARSAWGTCSPRAWCGNARPARRCQRPGPTRSRRRRTRPGPTSRRERPTTLASSHGRVRLERLLDLLGEDLLARRC